VRRATIGHVPRPAAVTVRRSRFWATNTTVVAAPSGCLLVDPGVYADELRATAATLTGPVLAVVHTHAHWDHILWASELDRPGRPAGPFVTAGTRKRLDRDLPALRRLLVDAAAGREEGVEATEPWDPALIGLGLASADGAAVPWPGPEAVLLETGGHLTGHGSLHLPDLEVLLAGDLLSDVDVPFPDGEDADLQGYRSALDRLVALPRVMTLVPGHGSSTDRAGLLRRADADRRYLDALGAALGAAGSEAEALTLAARIPDERLADPAVRRGHDASVRALASRRSRAAFSSPPAAPGR
jgi:glyoxylase-like metal-dependent hydrolase (beta-lactamase superfamily II)